MKITARNTALHFLDDPNNIDFVLPPSKAIRTLAEMEATKKSIKDLFPMVAPYFKESVKFISMPFSKAYEKAKHKLVNVFDKEAISESGTFILHRDTQYGSYTNTIFYLVRTGVGDDGIWSYELVYMQFNKSSQQDYFALDVMVSTAIDADEILTKSHIWEGLEKDGAEPRDFSAFIISFLLFIKYVELETKIIEPNRKAHHVGIKYVNETKQKIEVLDSTWFTTIVRSAGFTVNGFFRMQRYGKGLSEQRLKWIDPFEKHGYTRKAKILSQ